AAIGVPVPLSAKVLTTFRTESRRGGGCSCGHVVHRASRSWTPLLPAGCAGTRAHVEPRHWYSRISRPLGGAAPRGTTSCTPLTSSRPGATPLPHLSTSAASRTTGSQQPLQRPAYRPADATGEPRLATRYCRRVT